MQRYLTKLKTWVFLPLVFIVLFVTVAVNIFLFVSHDTMMQAANKGLPHTISVENIFFVFPNMVVLINTTLNENSSPSQGTPLVIPRVMIKFSMADLLAGRRLSVTHIVLRKPRLNYHYSSAFLQRNFQEILTLFKRLPKGDLTFHVRKAMLDLAPVGMRPNYVSADFTFRRQGDIISGQGSLRKDKDRFTSSKESKYQNSFNGQPLRFSFMGFFTSNGFILDTLALRKDNFYSNLWGDLKGDTLQLNGFAFLNSGARRDPVQNPLLNFIARARSLLKKEKTASLKQRPLGQELYLLDINSKMKLRYPQVQIEHLTFTANDAPVSLKGDLVFSDKLSLDITALFSPATSRYKRIENFKHADLEISGTLEPNAFDSSGRLNVYFSKDNDSTHSLERFEVNFKNLALTLDEQSLLRSRLKRGEITFWVNGNRHKVLLQDARTMMNLREDKFKIVEVYSPFYDGELLARAWVDWTRFPLRVVSSITLSDVDANQLSGMLTHFSKIQGRLFGKISFKNHPELDVRGAIKIKGGVLKDFEFFLWLADSFDLPSLKEIDSSLVSANFFVDSRQVQLQDILLKSANITMTGNFSIDANDLVSSKLSLTFQRELLKESRKFRPILRMFEKDVSSLDFDFQLSGNQQTINFQWLESDVKKRIQDRIPDFIERKIERRIDDSLLPADSPAPR